MSYYLYTVHTSVDGGFMPSHVALKHDLDLTKRGGHPKGCSLVLMYENCKTVMDSTEFMLDYIEWNTAEAIYFDSDKELFYYKFKYWTQAELIKHFTDDLCKE